MLGSLCKRFHREESAQISFLAVAGVVCFVGLLSMIINTDDIVTDRVHMQDVADTTAISSAAWTARGLNMISFINVMNSKLISTAVLLNALADTLEATRIVGEIQRGIFQACSGVPFVGAFCAAYAAVLNVQLAVLQPLEKAVDELADALSRCGENKNGALWSVMNALQAAATAVKESFTVIGIAESIDMAKANGADFGLVVNGNMLSLDDAASLLSLPVREAEEGFPAFCPFVKNGGSGYKMAGYECGEGPFKVGKDRIMKTILLPFANMFAHPIFIGMSASHFSQIGCTADPDPENDSFEVMLKDHNECRQYDQEAKWAHLYSLTGPLTQGNLGTDHFAPWKPLEEYEGEHDEDLPDQGEIEEQLGGINVTPDDPDGVDGKNVTMGSHYGDLGSEVALRDGFDVDCNGQRYPVYAPPPAGFNSDDPGNTLCFLDVGSDCRRIDEWSPQFTWYSGNHIEGGPKDVGGYFMRVGKRTIEPPEDEPDTPTKYAYIVETVSLVSAGTKEMNQQEFEDYMNQNNQTGEDLDTEASASSRECEKPTPYVLDKEDSGDNEDFYNKLRFMSVVYRDISDDRPFWSNYFDEPPETLVAYAQAQVYNHLAEDTFTQDWRVRLEQASLLETLVDSGKVPGGALGGFGNVIGTINNH